MDFLDEDPPLSTATREDSVPPPRRERPPRRPQRQQIMIRRAIAAGAGLLFLILLLLGVRGCLDARKERALKDYARDVAALVGESKQVSERFFARLDDPGSLSPTEYEAEVASDRSSVESELSRAEKLDVPGDMNKAQNALILALQLRRDAMTEISNRLPTALGDENREEAVTAISEQMQTLLASDVVFLRLARPEMERVLAEGGIEGPEAEIPDARFLPEGTRWLEESAIDDALGQVSGASTTATPGVHGIGLLSASVDGSALEEGVPVTVPAGAAPEIEVEAQNQGESDESGVTVSVSVDGGDTVEQQIDTIAPGETQAVTIPITPAPQGTVTLDVEVEPVPGEEVSDNNRASYEVTFE